jgi:anti-sigma B factor antagonist
VTVVGEPIASTARQEGVDVVTLAGDLDLFSAEILRRELEEAVPGGPHVVVVDLAAVTFLDSTMLGLLLLAARRMETKDGLLVLASPGEAIERVLEISGLRAFLPVYDSVGEAVAVNSG